MFGTAILRLGAVLASGFAAGSANPVSLQDVELLVPVGGAPGCARLEQMLHPSLRLFWPEAHLTLVFDDTEQGRSLARRCGHLGRIGFVQPALNYMYTRLQADPVTPAKFIGHVDDDTLFTTRVTREAIFDASGRPRVRGMVGLPDNEFWRLASHTTQRLLGWPEVARFMTYFPVVVKAEHFVEFRKFLAQRQQNADDFTLHQKGFSEFSLLLNYLYYFRGDEYSWVFQGISRSVARRTEPLWLSLSQHVLWSPGDGGHAELVKARLAEGYCRSTGGHAKGCERLARGLHLDLFRFEGREWSMHPNASFAQEQHYARVLGGGLLPRLPDEAWVAEAASAWPAAELSFPGRITEDLAKGLGLERPSPSEFTKFPRYEVIDTSQCFVGAGLVHAAAMVVQGNVSDLILHAVEGRAPWRVRRRSKCGSIRAEESDSQVLSCRLAKPLAFRPGDCVGWLNGARGEVLRAPGPRSEFLIRYRGGKPVPFRSMFALDVRWREP